MSENSSFRRICVENTEVIPVRDALGILWSSALLCTEDATAILPLWPQLTCGQAHFENWTYSAEKPPKKAVFQRKVVRVTGFEPAASCSQSRRATNCATPGYFVILSGWSYSPKASALPTALIPDFWLLSFVPDVVKHVVRRFFWPPRLAGGVPVS